MANEQSTWSSPEPAPLSIGKGAAKLGEIVVFIDGRTEHNWSALRRSTGPSLKTSYVVRESGRSRSGDPCPT